MKRKRRQPSLAARADILSKIARDSGLAWRLLRDPRVPKWLRMFIPGAVIAYVILPVDLIPDFVPVIGQADDLTAVLLGMAALVRLSPREAVVAHREALSGKTLWKVAHTKILRKDGHAQPGTDGSRGFDVQRQPSMSVAVRNLARRRR
ncbi:MAG: DUF1232 domain-containing protein [Chloroflexi bacterium]|nr:DUF1232 domain-containing protein [Chloroflexota bacterium]